MINLPPVNNIHLQSSSQDDPFDSLKKNLGDVKFDLNSSIEELRHNNITQALYYVNQAQSAFSQIQQVLPESGNSDEWNAIENSKGAQARAHIFYDLYDDPVDNPVPDAIGFLIERIQDIATTGDPNGYDEAKAAAADITTRLSAVQSHLS